MSEKWNDYEIKYLKKVHGKKSRKEIANELNRSIISVKKKAHKLGLINKPKERWTKEEEEYLKNNYEELGCKEVSKRLNRQESSVGFKAKQFGLKVNKQKPKISKEEIEEAVKDSHSYSDVLDKLYMVRSGGNTKVIRRYIEYYDINISHFDPQWRNKERIKNGGLNKRKPFQELFSYNSGSDSTTLKERLYKEGIKDKVCELCGQGEEWNDMKISLILDHIDGDNKNNELSNLRIVCPNCNAGLPTHCKGNKTLRKNKLTNNKNYHFNGLTEKQFNDKIKQQKGREARI